MLRRISLTLAALLAGSVVTAGLAAPAQATDYYRYWTFFTVENGSYVASPEGVGSVTPADGSIEAFRWAASADFENPNLPRVDLATVTFDSLCADLPAVDGQKRVAVIADFGVTEDAGGAEIPAATAECAQVPVKATALQVLQRVAEVRSKTSSFGPMLCAIDGFPATGCADEVTQTPTPADSGFITVSTADEADEDSGDNLPLYAGLAALVAVILGAGLVLARRRNSATA